MHSSENTIGIESYILLAALVDIALTMCVNPTVTCSRK